MGKSCILFQSGSYSLNVTSILVTFFIVSLKAENTLRQAKFAQPNLNCRKKKNDFGYQMTSKENLSLLKKELVKSKRQYDVFTSNV